METIGITDLYEASFLFVNDCIFTGVECVPMAGVLGCRILFKNDEELIEVQERFRSRDATVNLYKFRQAYNMVNSYIHQAKKSYEIAQKRSRGDL